MGGKALQRVQTRRYQREEYFAAWHRFATVFADRFPRVRVALVPSCHGKQSFGDMDVLLAGDQMPDNWHDDVYAQFDARGSNFSLNKEALVKANDVGYTAEMLLNRPYSFNLDELQVDLLPVASAQFDFTLAYLSYGDLGNLMGTVYRRLGARYGMQGLQVEPETATGERLVNHQVLLTLDHDEALRFGGYDPDRFRQGFESDLEVFEFVASSPFFCPTYYLENSRNSTKKRRRLAGRPAFARFQAWCEGYRDKCPLPVMFSDKDARSRLFTHFPPAEAGCKKVFDRLAEEERQRSRFSGRLLQEVTGATGPELGKLAEYLKRDFSSNDAFRAWLEKQSDEQLRNWVQAGSQSFYARAH